ncbi:MAG: hypothetical protein E7812_15015 [Phenylobacterium sp.]|nr:MAG: hypothetical protein E7812_15015 [Phenylobacterium sp.]
MALVVVIVALRVTTHAPSRPTSAAAPAIHAATLPPPPPISEDCRADAWRAAAAANRQSLVALAWAPFGRNETGWATYAPLIGREIATACGPDTPGFAAAYARWQSAHKLSADGVVKAADFPAMRTEIELRRPFVQLTSKGICPPPPADAALQTARPDEAYGGKPVQLRAGALAAYRALVAAAQAEGVAREPNILKLVSGFRGPAEESARCADGSCNTLTRASCSAHRTGLAMDLYLGHAPGMDPTSTDDANRAAMAATPEYRWLVANAGRFGFLPYPFEPWHWEWTGEAP